METYFESVEPFLKNWASNCHIFVPALFARDPHSSEILSLNFKIVVNEGIYNFPAMSIFSLKDSRLHTLSIFVLLRRLRNIIFVYQPLQTNFTERQAIIIDTLDLSSFSQKKVPAKKELLEIPTRNWRNKGWTVVGSPLFSK